MLVTPYLCCNYSALNLPLPLCSSDWGGSAPSSVALIAGLGTTGTDHHVRFPPLAIQHRFDSFPLHKLTRGRQAARSGIVRLSSSCLTRATRPTGKLRSPCSSRNPARELLRMAGGATSGVKSAESSPYAGAVLVLISAVLFSLMGAAVASLSHIPSSQISLINLMVTFVGTGLCRHLLKQEDPDSSSAMKLIPESPELRRWMLARGIAGAGCWVIITYGVTQLPLGDATAIFFTLPCFTVLLSFIFLRSVPTLTEMACAALSVIGVALIAQPGAEAGYGPFQLLVAGLLLFGAGLGGSIPVMMKKLKDVHYTVPTMHVVFWGCVASILMLPIQGGLKPMTSKDLTINIGAGFLALGELLTMNLGMQLTRRPQVAAVMRQTEVIFSYLWQVILLSQRLTVSSALGAVLISVSALSLAIFPHPTQTGNVSTVTDSCDADGQFMELKETGQEDLEPKA